MEPRKGNTIIDKYILELISKRNTSFKSIVSYQNTQSYNRFCTCDSYNKNNKVTANNIISKEMISKIIFFLFNINPSTPIKNNNNEKVMFVGIYLLRQCNIYSLISNNKIKNFYYYFTVKPAINTRRLFY